MVSLGMSGLRLFVLGVLAKNGPMHGYNIKRIARTDRTELWTDVKVGSLYSALPRLASEGLLRVARNEQDGNRPERTVYELTDEGVAELDVQRDIALRDTALRADPVDLALQMAFDVPSTEIRAVFETRLSVLTAEAIAWKQQWDSAAPYLAGLEPLTFAHTALRLDAEIAWHRKVLDSLAVDEEPAATRRVTSSS
jgi:DNA-binding PadR family transcriptional regulator